MTAASIEFHIAPMEPRDWPGVVAVYAEGIASGAATFETEVPTWERWDRDHLDDHRLVARAGGEVLGWAALSRVSIREVYEGVAEASVYVAESARGSGIGEALLEALVASADAGGIWTVEAVASPRTRPAWRCSGPAASAWSGGGSASGSDVLLLERRSPEP
ncbi:MAG TPA: GNAT family N-acetyltransferase [Miltoncostaeaceae bacterium]|nr:GNAT family N-acetyltransferase [Miltoncostaeaceae bacterium]